MTIYEKLAKIQSTLKVPKGQYNSFGKYRYRNCEDILEAVKPLLAEVKAVIIIGDELELIGSRFYVKATARFIDCETDAHITNTAYAREEDTKKGMDGSQITGTSSSYARKYALNGLFAIDDTKDSDTTNGMPDQETSQNGETGGQSAKPVALTEEQKKELEELAHRKGKVVNPEKVTSYEGMKNYLINQPDVVRETA